MSELHRRYIVMRSETVGVGDIIILWYAAKNMRYSRAIITKVFNFCVNKEEYDKEDKSELIDYIYNHSNENN